MRAELVEILRCPVTDQPLQLKNASLSGGDIESGELVTTDGLHRYPVINHIPRFVSSDNYAKGFGFQWNKFRSTQLDSYAGIRLSYDRFFESSGWAPAMLKGKRVLEVGCGAGRFTEIALNAGAELIALDYSMAVDACWLNHGKNPMLNVVQGNIYCLPFMPASFDFVYCFGVIQHTPDPKMAFMMLPKQLKPGGGLAVDVYRYAWPNAIWPKYWLRGFTRHIQKDLLFSGVKIMVGCLLPISSLIRKIPRIGKRLSYFIPVCNYDGAIPLSKVQLREWAILDTFDMLAPTYDYPQTISTLRSWFEEADMRNAEVFRRVLYVGRGTKAS